MLTPMSLDTYSLTTSLDRVSIAFSLGWRTSMGQMSIVWSMEQGLRSREGGWMMPGKQGTTVPVLAPVGLWVGMEGFYKEAGVRLSGSESTLSWLWVWMNHILRLVRYVTIRVSWLIRSLECRMLLLVWILSFFFWTWISCHLRRTFLRFAPITWSVQLICLA